MKGRTTFRRVDTFVQTLGNPSRLCMNMLMLWLAIPATQMDARLTSSSAVVAMVNARDQVITGVVAPQAGEALIREVFPSVAAMPAVASLGRMLIRSIALAPLGWALMLPFYFLKILPFLARRYTLTNRRVMLRRGLKPVPDGEVKLSEIDDVRVVTDANSQFFRAGTLEIVSGGKVALTLPGCPEADAFRISVLNACRAWAPGRLKEVFVAAK
jgi:PH (Pleckstrin Homology) domain-containing protein